LGAWPVVQWVHVAAAAPASRAKPLRCLAADHMADGGDAVAALSAALGGDITGGAGKALVDKLGGEARALGRYLEYQGGDVEAAAAAVRATIEFRVEHGVDTIATSQAEAIAKVAPYWFSSWCPHLAPDGSPILFYKAAVAQPAVLVAKCTEEEILAFYLSFVSTAACRTH
jgi:hypothetical protein